METSDYEKIRGSVYFETLLKLFGHRKLCIDVEKPDVINLFLILLSLLLFLGKNSINKCNWESIWMCSLSIFCRRHFDTELRNST